MIDIKNLTFEEIFILAVENHQKKNYEIAIDLYDKTLEIQPNFIDSHNNLGLIFEELEENKKAINCYQKVITINPNNSNAYFSLGNMFEKLKEDQKAINYYKKVINIDPKHDKAHYNLGLIFGRINENQKSKACFEKVIEIDPENDAAHNNLGVIFINLGDNQKAIQCYNKAIEINPNHLAAYTNLGKIFDELGENQKAIKCYEKVIEIDPDNVTTNNNLGIIFKNAGENLKAIKYYEKVIEIDPDNEAANNNLGVAFKEKGEDLKAIKCYEKVIEVNPTHAAAYNNLGIIHSGIGNHQKSVENFRNALINRSDINLEIHEEEKLNIQPATSQFFLELTNKCNFHCEFCPSDSQTRLHGYMDLSLVKKIFDEIAQKKIVTIVSLHLMGEPTLHPKLNEILAYANSKNVKVSLTTNGSTLVKKRVPVLLDSIYGEIVASLMTPTKETYKIRGDVGLSWDRYIDNFCLLIREHLKKILKDDKIKYEIIFRVMVSNDNQKGIAKVLDSPKSILENYNEWSNFTEIVEKELGLKPFNRQKIDSDATFFKLGGHAKEVSFYLQKNIKIQFWRAFTFANSRVKDEYKLLPQEKTQYCPHPFTDFGILWNGDVSLCCLDYDATLKVGNVKNHSVEDVLKSTDSKKLRSSMHGLEELHPTCVKCQSRPVEL